jgi:hypothetical protein
MTNLSDIFSRQAPDSIRDKFEQTTSFKDFFINHDGLHNLESDLVFTIKQRYTCNLKCQMCFLHDEWLSNEQMKQFVPETINQDIILNVFDYFDKVASIDDLRDLKTNHKDLFDFYKQYAHTMEYHTSDNGFFSQFDILTKDLKFKEIGQISFSDYLLEKKDGKIVDDIIEKLSRINDISPISRINFVITNGNPENNPHIMKLCDWLTKIDHTTNIYFHNDIRHEVDFFNTIRQDGYSQPSCYHIEHSTTPPTKCNVFSETCHLRYDHFFPDLYTSMDENHYPFYEIKQSFNPEMFLVALLKEKLKVYQRNVNIMTTKNKLYDYFYFIINNLKVNHNFTFIPILLLDPKSKFYHKLIEYGFKNSYGGLLMGEKIIPILEWRK